MKRRISELEKGFECLKDSVEECIRKRSVDVTDVLDALTSLGADDNDHHKMFLERNLDDLVKAPDNSTLLEKMKSHWNYLDPSLLDHLVGELDLDEVKGQMKKYKCDLHQFKSETPLALFCQTQPGRAVKSSRAFREMVADFKWPKNRYRVTLEVVEQFQQEYASHYSLHQCAMMVRKSFPGSSLY